METPSPFKIKVPDFESNIPEHLLQNASPQDKWIMENLSVLTQKTDWQTGELIKGSETFERIENQVKIANGRTAKNETSIIGLIEKTDKINKEIRPIRFLVKWGKNKYVLVGLVVLIFVGIPYVASLNLTVKSFIGLFKFLYN